MGQGRGTRGEVNTGSSSITYLASHDELEDQSCRMFRREKRRTGKEEAVGRENQSK